MSIFVFRVLSLCFFNIGSSPKVGKLESLIDFLGDVQNLVIEWNILLIFTGLSIVRVFLLEYVSIDLSIRSAQKAFEWSVLIFGNIHDYDSTIVYLTTFGMLE